MQMREMSDGEFQRHALAILQRELGAEGFARFLRLYRSGSGDYNQRAGSTIEGRYHRRHCRASLFEAVRPAS